MICISGFVDDVMLSHNGANGPASKTTLCFVKFATWRHLGLNFCLRLQACLYTLTVALVRSYDDNAIGYVLPTLWMTSCFSHNRPPSAWSWQYRRGRCAAASSHVQ